ncbi:MAG: TonB-dependent receptor [Candidatus Marinimicrobia bacterium]|nr:TonB-dependent receptor [Candidatus Neomarinimicrobiota bacterium]
MGSKLYAVTLIVLLAVGSVYAGSGTISGVITGENGNPIIGANVWLKGTTIGSSTRIDGSYRISGIPNGAYQIIAAHIGNQSVEIPIIVTGNSAEINITMLEGFIYGEEVVVSSTLRPQKLVDAPGTISVVYTEELHKAAGFSFANSIQNVKGVNVYRNGIDGVGISARGFMTAYNYRFQLMTDGMNSMLTGNGFSGTHMNLTSKEDLERVEVVVGPSSALYGPNAHNGMMNVITLHPRDSQGGILVVGSGQNDIINIRGRYAGVSGPFSYKINAESLTGKDWDDNRKYWLDLNGNGTEDDGEFTIEGNNFPIEHLRGSGNVFYDLNEDIELTGGYSYYKFSTRNMTNIGHNIIKDWKMQRWNIGATHPRFFVRLHGSENESGEYYQEDIRALVQLAFGLTQQQAIDATNLVDKSTSIAGEVQGNILLEKINLIGGVSWEHETPISERTVLLDRGIDPISGLLTGENITVDQVGFYGQVERDLIKDFEFTTAFRFDTHSNYESQLSPRFGLVWKGLKNGNFRVTWNRAFQAPSIAQQYLYIAIPGSRYQAGNGLGFTLADGSTIDPLEPEINETFEFGYKGTPLNRLFVDGSYYISKYTNFISGFIPVGNAVKMGDTDLDPSLPLLTYLNFGEVTLTGFDVELKYSLDNSYRLFGNFSFVDASDFDNEKEKAKTTADAQFYSGFFFNTAEMKWHLGIEGKDIGTPGLDLSIKARHVNEYDFVSGKWSATQAGAGTIPAFAAGNPYYADNGPLGGFTLVDLNAAYPVNETVSLVLNIENVFDTEAFQMVGSPSTARLAILEVKYSF